MVRRSRRELLRDLGAVGVGSGVLAVLPSGFASATLAAARSGGSAEPFYVSPDGDDLWSGRLAEPAADGSDGPVATLAAARDAVRRLKAEAGLTHPVDVVIRGGTYYLTES